MVTALEAGFRVRAVVTRAEQENLIKATKSIQPHLTRLEFAVVPDLIKRGALDAVVKYVVFVLHIASPLAFQVRSDSISRLIYTLDKVQNPD